MHRYLYNYRTNTYNSEHQYHELDPIPGSNITKAILFAGRENEDRQIQQPPDFPHPLPLSRTTFLYLETNAAITNANLYLNLTLISQMVRLETGLPAEPSVTSLGRIRTFNGVLRRYGSSAYYNPDVSYGGMVNTPDGIPKVAALCHFLSMVSEADAVKFENALQSFMWAQETSGINPHLRYTLFMSLYLSSINQLADNPRPVCPSPLVCPDCHETLNMKHSTSHIAEMERLLRSMMTGPSVDAFVALTRRLYHRLRSNYFHDGLLSGDERTGGFLADNSPDHLALAEDMANLEVLNRNLLGLFLQNRALSRTST